MNPPTTRLLRTLCGCLAASVGATLLVAAPARSLEPGEPAPPFSVPSLTGEGNLSLSAFQGKVVYLDFWASWCPPCLTSLPQLEKLRGEFPADRFQVLAINLDSDPEKARRFLRKLGIGYPSGIDATGIVPERFEIGTMPTSFLIDGRGVVRHVHEGFREGDVALLRDRIRSLVAAGER